MECRIKKGMTEKRFLQIFVLYKLYGKVPFHFRMTQNDFSPPPLFKNLSKSISIVPLLNIFIDHYRYSDIYF